MQEEEEEDKALTIYVMNSGNLFQLVYSINIRLEECLIKVT